MQCGGLTLLQAWVLPGLAVEGRRLIALWGAPVDACYMRTRCCRSSCVLPYVVTFPNSSEARNFLGSTGEIAILHRKPGAGLI